jgi:ABC-2 type transport system permease protein
MTALRIAMAAEFRKAAASLVFRTVTVLVIAGIAVLAVGLVIGARSGNERVLDQLGPLGDHDGWPLLINVVAQITSAGGLLALGIVLSWTFAREFTDGTISSLFAIPIRRSTIAAAKLIVYGVWATGVAVAVLVVVTVIGLGLGYGLPDMSAWSGLGRLTLLVVLSALLALPAAVASTLGRGLLPGIGVTVGIVVVAQVGVISGAGGWIPFAAPALWAIGIEHVTWVQLALAAALSAVFVPVVTRSWNRLQLDR